ncbi:MAG: hypothetical protein EPN79_15745 [Burkholderiaceae bacterium]|nr:MAG: hypothetical protein EPN79_15745 [Burkholderiaceae bacterium]
MTNKPFTRLAAMMRWLWQHRPFAYKPWRVRFTGRSLVIGVYGASSDSDGAVGAVHVVPRTRLLKVVQSGKMLSFRAADKESDLSVDVPFTCASDAAAALHAIQSRLLSNRPAVWAGRVLAVVVVWLLVSSYHKVQLQQAASLASQTGVSAPPLAALPEENGPMQPYPGAPTPLPPPAAAGPMAPIPVPASGPMGPGPEPVDKEPADGLSGFGLDLGAAGDAPQAPAPGDDASARIGPHGEIDPTIRIKPSTMAAVSASVNGPGCDPALAFKAPAR